MLNESKVIKVIENGKEFKVIKVIENGKEYYVIYRSGGDILYYKDDEFRIAHRECGPAVNWGDGSKFWYKDGKLHREDGPAIEYGTGRKRYLLNGEYYKEEEYWAIIKLVAFV